MTHELNGLPAKVMAALQGREMADILASAEKLNHLKQVSGSPKVDYELRVLRIPGLCVEAFWLKSPAGAEPGDVIVPYGLVLGGTDTIKLFGGGTLKKDQAYPAADFLEIAKDAARKRLAVKQRAPLAGKAGS
jgi:hypothetical protein